MWITVRDTSSCRPSHRFVRIFGTLSSSCDASRASERRSLACRSPGSCNRRKEGGSDQICFHRRGRWRVAAAAEVRHPREGLRIPDSRCAVSGCAVTIPMSTNVTMPRFMAKRPSAPRQCRCHTSIRGSLAAALLAVWSICRIFKQIPQTRFAAGSRRVGAPGQHQAAAVGRARQPGPHRVSDRAGAAVGEPPICSARRVLSDGQDRRLEAASSGQRVQIIKPDIKRGGLLEFGTELVGASDHSLVALLGASPGASTAAFIAISVLQKYFAGELTPDACCQS